jgi:hypothetical protein
MVRFLLFDRRFSAVEIGDQRQITGLREPVGYAANESRQWRARQPGFAVWRDSPRHPFHQGGER